METVLVDSAPQTRSLVGLNLAIAWRNLWRNRRRTWLTAAGIAFGCLLVSFSMSLQVGSYDAMIESATGFLVGHAQVSHVDFVHDEKIEQSVVGSAALVAKLRDLPGIEVAPRAQGFALVSVGERSFGGLVMGVDFAAEAQVVKFFQRLSAGDLPGPGEVLIGEVMARNLGATIGDELVLLGTAKGGGVAALALRISGLFRSGQAELDRSLVFAQLAEVQAGFGLSDQSHQLVLRYRDREHINRYNAAVAAQLPEDLTLRGWPAVLPEVVQSIELDRVSARLFYGAILLIVVFSIVNTFVMIVFERTREFGMLLAVGMRPRSIIGLVQMEAALVWLLGAAIGVLSANLIVGYLASVGIPLSGVEGMGDLAAQFYLSDRIYPGISVWSLCAAPLALLVGTQLGALLSTLRIRKLRPVQALRAE